MPARHRDWIEALVDSHGHLKEVVADLGQRIEGPSYCSDWTIAQVLSHLGSGAEIWLLGLQAVLNGEDPPARERYVEIWDVWNAKSPSQQAADALEADDRSSATVAALDDATLDRLQVPMWGFVFDASEFVAARLSEHVLHSWDIEVMVDPTVGLQPGDVELLIDSVSDRVGRSARGAKPATVPARIEVEAGDPSRRFALSIEAETVSIDDEEAKDGRLVLPAESLLRLIAGRLDTADTPPSVAATGSVSLEELRALFPGY